MMKEENKVDFDLSKLTLQELINTYQNIDDFLSFLADSKIEIEKKEDNDE